MIGRDELSFCTTDRASGNRRQERPSGGTARPRGLAELFHHDHLSIGPPPRPPSSSLNGAPSRPSSANAPHFGRQPSFAGDDLAAGVEVILCRMKAASVASSCLGVAEIHRLIFLPCADIPRLHGAGNSSLPLGGHLKAQDHLGDDVALDLVRSAVDRRLAHVEIGRRRAVGVVRTDRVLVVAFAEAAEIRRAIVADGFQRELGDALLDLGALDLQDRAFRARALAGGFRRPACAVR